MDASAYVSGEVSLRSSDFRRERQAQWITLENILDQVERKGLNSLEPQEIYQLPALYRATVSSLSVARTISLDKNLLEYLESLATRAYFWVYGVKPRPASVIKSFLLWTFPRNVSKLRWGILSAVLITIIGVLVGLALDDSEAYLAVVPQQLAQGRGPTSTTEELRKVLYSDDEHSGDELSFFTAYLFTHNARIGLLSFALGFALGLPVILLLFYNGLMLGVMAGLYSSRGLALDFWAWVLPHGITELLAVCLCGGAGLALAAALVKPGRYGRMEGLSKTGKSGALVVLGAVLMLVVAGVVEGVFRQMVTDVTTRFAMALASGIFWAGYFFLGPGKIWKDVDQADNPGEKSRWSSEPVA